MSKNFTISFVPYQTQRPELANNPIVMNNVQYSSNPVWHTVQTSLQVARNVPQDNFLVQGNAPANMSVVGLTTMTGVTGVDDIAVYLPLAMDFFFFGTNYRNTSNAPGVFWNTNNVIGFGTTNATISWLSNTGRAILVGNADRRTNNFSYSAVSNISNVNYINTVLYAQNFYADGIQSTLQWQMRLFRSPNNQYVEVRMSTVGVTQGNWNLTNGTTFQNTFGALSNTAGQKGSSFVLRSDLNGFNWELFYSYYVNL